MNYYKEIKKELIDNEAYKKVKDYSKNRSDLNAYYNVGKLIVEAQGGESRAKYGDGLIKDYSKKLTEELGKGYTISSLKRMRQFYLIIQKGATVSSQLTWSHYIELLLLDDVNKISYYQKMIEHENLFVRQLRYRLKNNEYERLDEKAKNRLINKEKEQIGDFIKNPILIKIVMTIKKYQRKY